MRGLLFILIALFRCTTVETLPPPRDDAAQPTFVFFYTNN
jgi:hypothetical protein